MKEYRYRENELFQLGLKYVAAVEDKHNLSVKKGLDLAQQICDFCEWVEDNKKSMDKVEPISEDVSQKPFHN